MADEAQDTEAAHGIEAQIKAAIYARSSYFQDQADSLTLEKVRRLLEKDLGLEVHALDAHKRFVKQWLHSCIESATVDNSSKGQDEAGKNVVSSIEEAKPADELQEKNEAEKPIDGDVETMEDSPVMGLMTGSMKAKTDAEYTENKLVPNEIMIKKAIWARASYLRENSENITLVGLRRLLEEDLEFEKHSLDPFKKVIGQEVDEVLFSSEAPQSAVSEKKKNSNKVSNRKVSSNSKKAETSASSGNESDEVEEKEVKVRKRSATKTKQLKTESVIKRKKTEEDTKGSRKNNNKVSKSASEGSGEEEEGNSDSSAEKPVKKKEVPKPPSYGKQVERLKALIKSCGLSISPAVYKKVKQAPENKREACLIKELEEMLAKEGLSTNPSEKEIKDVKKRKERAKELEGIDLSNIVSSGRRRSTTTFIPPPKPKIPDLSESESEESENDDDEDDVVEADEEVENEEADEDQENDGNGSQSVQSD